MLLRKRTNYHLCCWNRICTNIFCKNWSGRLEVIVSKEMSLISPRRKQRRWKDDRPAGLSHPYNREGRPSNKVQIDEDLERLSWLMDSQFRVPGLNWRFGLNTFIDLIPGIGDA